MENEMLTTFNGVIDIITNAKENAYKRVNEELISMYWNIGKFVSEQSQFAEFGDAYVDSLAEFIQKNFPGIKGFTRCGLYRMRQFYEIYENDEFVSALLTQISWTNHLMIMSKAKTKEERHFYLTLSSKERYSSRELERQINSAYYERYMLSKDKIPAEASTDKDLCFLDTYVLEFLNLPNNFKESDLKKALLSNLKDFLLEFGKRFYLC